MTRLRIALASLLAVGIGCSPVVDRSNSPDAPPVDPDTTAPAISSSNPEAMGTAFSIIQPISVYFDEELDPATVSASSVTLQAERPSILPWYAISNFEPPYGQTVLPAATVPGTVAYDAATRRITYTPTLPLAYGTHHVLTMTDLKDAAGNAFSGTIPFRTYVNGVIREMSFNGGTGASSTYNRYPVDDNGYPDKRLIYGSAGNDTIWYTADDPPAVHYAYTYDANGRITEEHLMDDGVDNRLDTSDDVSVQRFQTTYDTQGLIDERVYYAGGGTDGVFGTPDDVIGAIVAHTNTSGSLANFVFYVGAGTDTMWRTPDDRCNSYWTHEYGTPGLRTRETRRTCSTDQLPMTADDGQTHVYDYEYDANGLVTRSAIRTGPGTDTLWDTEDDLHSTITRTDRDASGLVTGIYTYTNAGTDNLWATDDDVIGSHQRYTYDEATKLPTMVTTYNAAGTDTMWGTDDDVISGYVVTTYDALGNRVDSKTYNAGADAMWHTPDDRVTLDVDYDTTY